MCCALPSRDSKTFCAFWSVTQRKYILSDIILWQCERPHSWIGIRSEGMTYKLARRLRVCGPWTVLLTGRRVGWDSIVGGEFLLLRKLQDLPNIPEGGGGIKRPGVQLTTHFYQCLCQEWVALMTSSFPSSRYDVQNQKRYHFWTSSPRTLARSFGENISVESHSYQTENWELYIVGLLRFSSESCLSLSLRNWTSRARVTILFCSLIHINHLGVLRLTFVLSSEWWSFSCRER